MKAAIFSFVSISDDSMVASVRIARYVRDELRLPLIWTEEIGEHDDLDVLLVVNGAYAFCRCREAFAKAVLGAKRIVWIQNDYSVVPPINDGEAKSPMRRAFVERRERGLPHLEFWTTCDKESRATPLSTYVNWNCLSMQVKPLRRTTVHQDVAYYGSFRRDRVKSGFDRFFREPKCPHIISSPSSQFRDNYPHTSITHVGIQDDLIKWLSERGLGLYLEDGRSHREFHSPPNRFYEMLSAGLPMVFEQGAGPTLRRSGYDPTDYTVSKPLEVARRLEHAEKIGREQRERWWDRAATERRELPARVQAAWAKLEDLG